MMAGCNDLHAQREESKVFDNTRRFCPSYDRRLHFGYALKLAQGVG